jgi:blue copper oxidase
MELVIFVLGRYLMTNRPVFLMMGAALLSVALAANAQMSHGQMGSGAGGTGSSSTTAPSALDSRTSRGMTNPLRVPRPGGPVLGYVDGSRPFVLTAKPADLEIAPGVVSALWVYEAEQDGRKVLNPLIRVKRGDTMSVRFFNRLPEPTNVHWHGLRVPRAMDGNPADLIKPGGEYRYEFRVDERSALYWYHPHPHGTTSKQAFRGLAGLIVVEDEDDRRLAEAVGLELGVTDLPLVLQDRDVGSAGELRYEPAPMDWFHGSYSSTVLVNLTPKALLSAEPKWYRFRVLNGSNARIYRLGIEANNRLVTFQVTGVDAGLLERPVSVKEAFVAPGERVDIMVDLSLHRGREVFLKSLSFDPMEDEKTMGGMMGEGGNGEALYLLRVAVGARVAGTNRRLPDRLTTARRPSDTSRVGSTRRLAITAGMMRWYIDGKQYDMEKYPIVVKRGASEVWEISNAQASMPHPMHIHGFHFRVLERRGSPDQAALIAGETGLLPTDLAAKDTILVWPGETVRVEIDFSHSFSGQQEYVFHCHNLEHESAGMMLNLRVEE